MVFITLKELRLSVTLLLPLPLYGKRRHVVRWTIIVVFTGVRFKILEQTFPPLVSDLE